MQGGDKPCKYTAAITVVLYGLFFIFSFIMTVTNLFISVSQILRKSTDQQNS